MELKVKKLPNAEGLPVPTYESEYAAGLDIRAAVDESVTINPGERVMIPTGLAIALPAGFEAQIRPRSGLAIREGITMLNSPGTIDADYRGEVKLIVINHGQEKVVISRGDRVAQMVIAPVVQATITEVDELSDTSRGAGGFGSTGAN